MTWLTGIGISIALFIHTIIGGVTGYFSPAHSPLAPTTPSVARTAVANQGAPDQQNDQQTTTLPVLSPPIRNSPSSSPSAATSTACNTRVSTPTCDNEFGCYEDVNNSIEFFGTSSVEVLSGADPSSFVDLSQMDICFGKDKNHVYENDQILPWADPATFSLLMWQRGPLLFFQNGTQLIVWSSHTEPQMSPACDGFCGPYKGPTATATPITGPHGPTEFYVVPNGDPSTFVPIDDGADITDLAKDKNNVYCDGVIISGADPSTFMINITNNKEPDFLDFSVVVDGARQFYNTSCDNIALPV